MFASIGQTVGHCIVEANWVVSDKGSNMWKCVTKFENVFGSNSTHAPRISMFLTDNSSVRTILVAHYFEDLIWSTCQLEPMLRRRNRGVNAFKIGRTLFGGSGEQLYPIPFHLRNVSKYKECRGMNTIGPMILIRIKLAVATAAHSSTEGVWRNTGVAPN